jgi:hypothetical protein
MGLLFIPQVICEYGEPWWNDIDRRKPKNSEKNLSNTNPTWTDPGTNLCCERPVTNRLSHGMAF